MPTVHLQSSDGQVFDVDEKVAKCSVTIKTMLEDFGIEETSDTVIPLPNVNAATLKKVIEWASHHQNDTNLLEDVECKKKADGTNVISSWDADFLKLDQGTLLDLVTAANYLDVKPLMSLVCATVANMIKGKTSEEICKTFNIKCDLDN